ncbi:MAG: hypothetical protein AAGG68_10430 [Bacteroidota bacterium]
MKLKYNIAIVLLITLVGFSFTESHNSVPTERAKSITKTFPISADGTTKLANKYGKMEINVWDKDEVKITVNVKVDARNDRKEEEILESIDVDFDNGSDYVSAETEFSMKGGYNNMSYKIEYEVFMPATNNLKASMKYGNLRLGKLKGKADIEVKYGNFHVESIGDNSTIELAYSNSDCTIVEAQNLTCDVSYSRLHIYQAENIELDTKYSQGVEIESCKDLDIDSKYDRYTIGKTEKMILDTEYSNFSISEIENASIDADYTNVKIGTLKNSLNVDLSYNNCVVEKVLRGFSKINMEGNHASFKLGVEKDASYRLIAEGKYSDVRFDDDGMDIKRDIRKSNAFEIEGSKGSSSARSRIVADLSYGGLKIWEE